MNTSFKEFDDKNILPNKKGWLLLNKTVTAHFQTN